MARRIAGRTAGETSIADIVLEMVEAEASEAQFLLRLPVADGLETGAVCTVRLVSLERLVEESDALIALVNQWRGDIAGDAGA